MIKFLGKRSVPEAASRRAAAPQAAAPAAAKGRWRRTGDTRRPIGARRRFFRVGLFYGRPEITESEMLAPSPAAAPRSTAGSFVVPPPTTDRASLLFPPPPSPKQPPLPRPAVCVPGAPWCPYREHPPRGLFREELRRRVVAWDQERARRGRRQRDDRTPRPSCPLPAPPSLQQQHGALAPR